MGGDPGLRIAAFVEEFPTISQTFVITQIAGLLQLGHDVSIRATLAGDPVPDTSELIPRTRYLAPPAPGPGRRLLALPGLVRSCSAPDRARLVARSLAVTRYGRHAWSGRLLHESLSYGSRDKFDVVHSHFGPSGLRAVRLRDLGLVSGPVATSFHGVEMSRFRERLHGPAYQRLFEHGDLFLPVSRLWADRLSAAGCRDDRITVHHMGVDTGCLHPRLRRRGTQSGMVLSVGRLVEKKGFEDGVRAVARAVANGRSARYVIVGDGPLKQRLVDLADALQVGDLVEFHGSRPPEAVRELMAEADLLVAPSVTDGTGDMEGIPIVLMEAMAIGLPVLSTNHSGIPELVTDRRTGFLVPEACPAELGSLLSRLLAEPLLRRSVVDAARRTVVRDFDAHTQNSRLAALLAALARRGARGHDRKDTRGPRAVGARAAGCVGRTEV